MKKFASILLALVLCVAMAVPAFAADVVTYNGGISKHLVASNASTGTVTFEDSAGKVQTAYVYPASTVIGLNASAGLVQFNGISDAQNPFHDLGIAFWSATEFTPEAGIYYKVESFDGATFAGDTCYLTVGSGSAAPVEPEEPAEPEVELLPMPAVTNKPGKTTIQADSWTDIGLVTMTFETLKVEKVSLPAPGLEGKITYIDYLVLVLKPGSQLPYIDCVSPLMFFEDAGFYTSEGSYPGPSGVAEDAFAPDYEGGPVREYVKIYGTDYDLPVLISMKSAAAEPEAPAETPAPTPTPSEEPEAPVEDQPEPEPETEPAPSEKPETETPVGGESAAKPEPSAQPEAPVEDGSGFPVGIVVAIVAVVVIAAVVVVVLKKKK